MFDEESLSISPTMIISPSSHSPLKIQFLLIIMILSGVHPNLPVQQHHHQPPAALCQVREGRAGH